MDRLVSQLRALNRKERFYLVGLALDNKAFALGQEFLGSLKTHLGLDVPGNAFVAMDYHLSWLYAATVVAEKGGAGPFPSGGGIELVNQEDVDLIVAWDEGQITHLLVLEAKGVTNFSNRQLRSKVDRLKLIFGDGEGDRLPFVRPRFAIVSPVRPVNVQTSGWPKWVIRYEGKPDWIPMPIEGELMKITRCDSQGRTAALGGYWKAEPDRIIGRQSLVNDA